MRSLVSTISNAFYDPAIKEANVEKLGFGEGLGAEHAFQMVQADIVHDDLSSLFTPENRP